MIIEKPTLTEMWHSACETLLFAEKHELGVWSGVFGTMFGNFLRTPSLEFDFDVGRDLWLTSYRFPKLQRDYLDPTATRRFIDDCCRILEGASNGRAITMMHTKEATQKDGTPHHKWGNCIVGMSFWGSTVKRAPNPTFGLHSRVCYISYLGAMDLALVWCLAREVSRRTGYPLENMGLHWHLDAAGWHSFKGLAYVFSHGLMDEILDEELYPSSQYPVIGRTRRYAEKMAETFEKGEIVTKYGPVRRITQRYFKVHDGRGMPSVPLESLTLLPQFLES